MAGCQLTDDEAGKLRDRVQLTAMRKLQLSIRSPGEILAWAVRVILLNPPRKAAVSTSRSIWHIGLGAVVRCGLIEGPVWAANDAQRAV